MLCYSNKYHVRRCHKIFVTYLHLWQTLGSATFTPLECFCQRGVGPRLMQHQNYLKAKNMMGPKLMSGCVTWFSVNLTKSWNRIDIKSFSAQWHVSRLQLSVLYVERPGWGSGDLPFSTTPFSLLLDAICII